MTISPTLGISNQYDARPVMEYASIASQSLQQLGAQLQQDITTIQTNQQLRSFSQDLQGIDPMDTKSPQFASQMTQAITNNPLAAHSPVGIAAINQLGAAHQAAIQSSMLGQRLQTQEDVAGIRAGATTEAAGIKADASKYGTDVRLKGVEEGLGFKQKALDQTEEGKNARAAARIQSQQDLANNKIHIQGPRVFRADGSLMADYSSDNVPATVMSSHQRAASQLANAQAENIQAETAWKKNPNDPSAQSLYNATQAKVNGLAKEFQEIDQKYHGYSQKASPAGAPAGGAPAQAAPKQQGASNTSSVQQAYQWAQSNPSDPKAQKILEVLKQKGLIPGGQ